jgi:hypothetical protein
MGQSEAEGRKHWQGVDHASGESYSRRAVVKPPLGVMPRAIWEEHNPDPDLFDLYYRFSLVCEAIARYRAKGFEPPYLWLHEAGLLPCA